MSEEINIAVAPPQIEQVLRERLAGGDMVMIATPPILRHLLANRDQSQFSDEVIARVRGMTTHVARQLLFARAQAHGASDPAAYADPLQDELAALLIEDSAFLAHAHGLTLEAQLAGQLQRRSNFDTVLSPLLQELTAAADEQLAALAMRVIAVQARFMQAFRRMELPLSELPGDTFHTALLLMRRQAGDDRLAEQVEAALRSQYDESESRIGLLSRLVMTMGRKAPRALAVDHAGLAIFTSALALAAGQDRKHTILTFGENQLTRLALCLRAAGLRQDAVEEQFLYLHPEAILPAGFDRVTMERAATLLAEARSEAGV